MVHSRYPLILFYSPQASSLVFGDSPFEITNHQYRKRVGGSFYNFVFCLHRKKPVVFIFNLGLRFRIFFWPNQAGVFQEDL